MMVKRWRSARLSTRLDGHIVINGRVHTFYLTWSFGSWPGPMANMRQLVGMGLLLAEA
jgi:hypothetical protein